MFIVINIFKSRGFFVNLCKHVVSVSMYAVSEQRCEKQGINQKVIVNSKNKSQVSPDKSYA